MNYIVVNSVCCCLSVCCKQVWQSLYRIIGKKAFIKFAYMLIYFGSVLGSILLLAFLNNSWSWLMSQIAPGIDCKNNPNIINCFSASVIYRISLCLFIFSIFMLLVMQICSSRVALIFNEGLFFSKFVFIMIMFCISLRIDNQFMMEYGNFCKIISYVFVLWQAIIIIDLGYLFGIRLANNYRNDNEQIYYAIILIGLSFLCFCGCLAFLIFSFNYHHQDLRWADILSVVYVILTVGVQLLNFNKQNSLLTTSLLCLLICYFFWSAGYSHPSTQTGQPGIENEQILYINMSVSFILLIISTAGSIHGSTNNQDQDNNRLIDLDNINLRAEDQQAQLLEKKKWIQWILYLSMMSAYIAMIASDWGSADIVKKQFNLTTGAWTSKLLMGSTIFGLYLWTLLAPKLCPHRNFYFQ